MSTEATTRATGCWTVTIISDPQGGLYRSFRLRRGRLSQLFGRRVWGPGVRAALRGHGVGKLDGDGFRMPGSFVVHRGRVVAAHRAESAADRPEYDRIASEACALVPDEDALQTT